MKFMSEYQKHLAVDLYKSGVSPDNMITKSPELANFSRTTIYKVLREFNVLIRLCGSTLEEKQVITERRRKYYQEFMEKRNG